MFPTNNRFPDFYDSRFFQTFLPVTESGLDSREDSCNASSSSQFVDSHDLTDMFYMQVLCLTHVS